MRRISVQHVGLLNRCQRHLHIATLQGVGAFAFNLVQVLQHVEFIAVRSLPVLLYRVIVAVELIRLNRKLHAAFSHVLVIGATQINRWDERFCFSTLLACTNKHACAENLVQRFVFLLHDISAHRDCTVSRGDRV